MIELNFVQGSPNNMNLVRMTKVEKPVNKNNRETLQLN